MLADPWVEDQMWPVTFIYDNGLYSTGDIVRAPDGTVGTVRHVYHEDRLVEILWDGGKK